MKRTPLSLFAFAALIALATSHNTFANNLVPAVPYTESFTTAANWSTTVSPPSPPYTPTLPTLVSTGGAVDGGSYVSRDLNLVGTPDLAPPAGPIPISLFRAENVFGSSGDKFENNWILGGINQFSFYVRHNAGQPLTYFARFQGPAGGPGVVFLGATVGSGSDWTKVSFDISPSSPAYIPEGPPGPTMFNTVMSDVGKLQIGFPLPTNFGTINTAFTYGLDQVTWNTPEPASCLLVAMAALSIGLVRRRRQAS